MRCFDRCRTMLIAAAVISAPLASAVGEDQSKTIQEGYMRAQSDGVRAHASFIEAQAQMLTAEGNVRKQLADTRKTLEECRSLAIDNNLKATNTFYEKRVARESYRASRARPAPSQEDLVLHAKAAAPQRLSPVHMVSRYGGIRWPAVLQREEFAAYREQLDVEFAEKSLGESGVGSLLYQQVREGTEQMRAELQGLIREVSPTQYIAAKRFIDSLANEARFSHVLDGVAAN